MAVLTLVPAPIVDSLPPIEALGLEDGGQGATVRSLCNMVDIARNGQIARIRRSPSLSSGLLTVTVATPGGPQATDVLIDWAIPIWATGLQTSRLPEEKRALALIVQQKAVAAIRRALSQPTPEPEEEAPAQPAEAPTSGSEQIKQATILLIEGFSSLEIEQQKLLSRQAALERDATNTKRRLVMIEQAIRDQMRPAQTFPGLPPERIGHLFVLLRQLRAGRGIAIAEALAALAAEFDVPDITDVPESAWPHLLDWFQHALQQG